MGEIKNELKASTEKMSDVCSIQEQSSTSSNKELFNGGCSKEENLIMETRTVKLKKLYAAKEANKGYAVK